MTKQKILVTGGAGFVGSNLIAQLILNGHDVHSIDNYDSGLVSNELDGCNYHNGDIENVSLMDSDFDVIYHLAALSRIQPSFVNPSETFRVNTVGTEAVLQYAKKINASVIYAGSSSKWHNPHISPYASAKHLGEELCKMYKSVYGLDVEIVRFYNVYGPGEIVDGDWAAVIGKWRRLARDGEDITIVGDGEQKRDFTHIDDIVDGLVKISESDVSPDDAWELGTGSNHALNDVYRAFNRRFNTKCIYISDQPGNYRETKRENDFALDNLNWKPVDRLMNYIEEL